MLRSDLELGLDVQRLLNSTIRPLLNVDAGDAACDGGGGRSGTGEGGIGGRQKVKLDERIGQVAVPIHERDAVLI